MVETSNEDGGCTELLIVVPLFAQEAYIKAHCLHCSFTRFLYGDQVTSTDVADAQYAHDFS
jgi:hypothetical protein